MKKSFAVCLALILCLLCAVPAVRGESTERITAGVIVTFGRYPQTEAGDDKTPIEWIVLDIQDGKALLLSKYGLDAGYFHPNYDGVNWEKCELRGWLNHEFLDAAFGPDEQEVILTTEVDNSREQAYSYWYYDDVPNTQDRIFLLSYLEAFDLYFHDDEARKCAPTDYAISRYAYIGKDTRTEEGKNTGIWWLRSPGKNRDASMTVSTDGTRDFHGFPTMPKMKLMYRPAMWVSLGNAFFPPAEETAETFSFRNGITWGMGREEVAAAEGSDGDYSEETTCSFLKYDEVKISKYSGHLVYAFSEDALQVTAYLISDAKEDTLDYMLNAYDTKYGEGQEADFQELFSILLKVNPDSRAPENLQDCTVRKWETSSGTEIWMIWGGSEYDELMIFYISPDLLKPQEEEIDMTGI